MIFDLPDFDDHEDVHFFADRATGMRAVIAVHSTARGPAAGGCRFWRYATDTDAVTDALRLSRGMSYKNAMAGLPMGGGKAVLIGAAEKTTALLEAFGSAVEALGGRYVTAEDVGMSVPDMVAVRGVTQHVAGLPVAHGAVGGDPGPVTARGVFAGLKSAVRHGLSRSGLEGVHVAVQGLGSVGASLSRMLAEAGARLTLADVDEARAARLAAELGAATVPPEAIMRVEADVFSPNALGAGLSEATIPALQARVVAGAANNQLATPGDGARLAERGILYAPDYVINAGGIMSVAAEYLGETDAGALMARVDGIEARLDEVFEEARATGRPTSAVADSIAQRLIGRGPARVARAA